jgi:hypothetical protein
LGKTLPFGNPLAPPILDFNRKGLDQTGAFQCPANFLQFLVFEHVQIFLDSLPGWGYSHFEHVQQRQERGETSW